MTIHEPMTFATDIMLTVCNLFLAWRLGKARPGSKLVLWQSCLVVSALAALFGGMHHGFPNLPLNLAEHFWSLTLVFLSLTALFLWLAPASDLCSHGPMKVLKGLAFLKGFALLFLALSHRAFTFALLDYGLSLLVFGLLATYGAFRSQQNKPGKWALGFFMVSMAAGAVQMGSWPNFTYFNHNDAYHLIQLAAMVMLYRSILAWHPISEKD